MLTYYFEDGGCGDQLARLPAVLFTYENHQHIYQHVWVPSYFLPLAQRMLPKSPRIIIRDYSQVKKKYNKDLQARAFSVHKYTNLASHMTDHAFAVLNYSQVEDKYKNYLHLPVDDIDVSKFHLPEKYVVIPPCFTSKTRIFLGRYINEIVDYLSSKGYSTVFIGNKSTGTGGPHTINANYDPELKLQNGINLIGATTLLEAAKIMKGAKCIVGLDNGLLHLAACVDQDLPIVYGFTTVKPEHRLPYRRDVKGHACYPVALTSSCLSCTFCQSNMTYTYNWSFTQCYYDDYKCLIMLDSSHYIKEIDKIL